jgi:hypothetical protein
VEVFFMGYTFRARKVEAPQIADLRTRAADDTGQNTVAEAEAATENRDTPPSFEAMTKPELIETATAQNIETAGLTKAQLIERLRA